MTFANSSLMTDTTQGRPSSERQVRSRVSILATVLSFGFATTATSTALALGVYAAMRAAGSPAEQLIRVAMVVVVVLFVHLLPTALPNIGGAVRVVATIVWFVGLTIVLYGQLSFVVLAQQQAGVARAAVVKSAPVVSNDTAGMMRSRVTLAAEVASVTTAIARLTAIRCTHDCGAHKVRLVQLTARLRALNVEDDELARHEMKEDAQRREAIRLSRLRDQLSRDPVAQAVARLIGATEARVTLLLGLFYAVVLEGAAVTGWVVFSGIQASRALSGLTVGFSRPDKTSSVPNERRSDVATEPDEAMTLIHAAVASQKIKPTQAEIRKFLRCGQLRAALLNRQYHALQALSDA